MSTATAGVSDTGCGLAGSDIWQRHAPGGQQLFAFGRQHVSSGTGTLAVSRTASSVVKVATTAFMRGQA